MSSDAVHLIGHDECMKNDPLLEVINTLDRPGRTFAVAAYAGDAVHLIGHDVCMKNDPLLEVINTLDRPGRTFAVAAYAGAGTCVNLHENTPGMRLPKAGAYAAAGVGYARAEWRIFEVEAKGPNASVGAGLASGHWAFAKAGLASASVSAGLLKATVGLAFDTGIGIGPLSLEVKVLGTGFSIGHTIGISLFGNSIEYFNPQPCLDDTHSSLCSSLETP